MIKLIKHNTIMNNILAIFLIVVFLLFIQSGALAQDKALQKQDNKAKAIYVPVKTKPELAAERLQKREKANAKGMLTDKATVKATLKCQTVSREDVRKVKVQTASEYPLHRSEEKKLANEKIMRQKMVTESEKPVININNAEPADVPKKEQERKRKK